MDGPLSLDGCNCRIDILGYDIPAEQQTARHVLAMSGIAFHLRAIQSTITVNTSYKGFACNKLVKLVNCILTAYGPARSSCHEHEREVL